MGLVIFEQSGTFKPADFGLGAGDIINVIVISGGCSGQGAYLNDSDRYTGVASVAGGDSSFGTYFTASSYISSRTSSPYPMGLGGTGSSFSWRTEGTAGSTDTGYAGGGGGGGLIVGIPFIGGDGGSGSVYSSRSLPTKNGGIGGYWYTTEYDAITSTNSISREVIPLADSKSLYGNLKVQGNGDYGATAGKTYSNGNLGAVAGAAGLGYGAGGGGCAMSYSKYGNGAGNGGNSGTLIRGYIKLTNSNNITVTVGEGGKQTISSTNSKAYGGNGADGVVIVTW